VSYKASRTSAIMPAVHESVLYLMPGRKPYMTTRCLAADRAVRCSVGVQYVSEHRWADAASSSKRIYRVTGLNSWLCQRSVSPCPKTLFIP